MTKILKHLEFPIILKIFPMQKGDLSLVMLVCSAGIFKALKGWIGDQ